MVVPHPDETTGTLGFAHGYFHDPNDKRTTIKNYYHHSPHHMKEAQGWRDKEAEGRPPAGSSEAVAEGIKFAAVLGFLILIAMMADSAISRQHRANLRFCGFVRNGI